ncbi:TIM barrel protein [Salsipaludibacter albus]|uniref:TIM barrel protein n=1 Tax=Salsipaludibacter albus TaxID=2849650 RepID=UPI001EE46DAE|nr:TIM barrel protein [Salsipaludibacter albus]MBY5161813.1 TIM barrel protein [Salsipaludibacter albus]
MLVGASVPSRDPLAAADARGADVVQVHLSAPRNWRAPRRREDAAALAASGRVVAAHAPYLCNPASADAAVRDRTTASLQASLDEAERCGVRGVVVHAGHAAGGGSMADALDRWVGVVERLASPVPLWIENTASGATAPGRRAEDFGALLTRLRSTDVVARGSLSVGAVVDTCHAWAGDPACAEDPGGWLRAVSVGTGGIDLLHVNDSRDPAGAGRDRHTNLGAGEMGTDVLATMVRTAAELGVPAALVETPSEDGGQERDLALLRTWLGQGPPPV